MNKNEYINFWVESADADLETAFIIYENKRYNWSLFIGHLVLEKILKAHFIKNNDGNVPPKIHNLIRLAELAKLKLEEDLLEFFRNVSNFQLESRYPEYKNEFFKIATEEFTNQNLLKIKEIYLWLKSLI
jgi:HEPN domain-containing protein